MGNVSPYGLGRPATEKEIQQWNIDVAPSGEGLPPGRGTLRTANPMKTIGRYWPYATTLYDYVYRAMPFSAPQSLTPDEVYSLVAWLLYRNGIVDESTVMDARSLPAVRMPNRAGFTSDPRPDVPIK